MWVGLTSCETKFIFLFIYVLFIYLFIHIYLIFIFLASVRTSVERCFHTYFSFCEPIVIYYGFLRAPWGSFVLVQLYVDGMQCYQQ